MLRRIAAAVLLLAAAGAALFWFLTAPQPLQAAALPAHEPDLATGERVFYAAGCNSCHAAPDARGEEALKLGGGLELNTPFGLFRVPNISPDPQTGIGNWSDLDFVNAMTRGLAPDGTHLYPAFPYTSYARMSLTDVIDLKAFLDTLPPVSNVVAGHELPFPYSVRRGLGLWKRLHLGDGPVLNLANADERVRRGQYLVEGPGHCGECHTPRDWTGALDTSRWLAGAPNPEGEGVVPNITPHDEGLKSWSESDIVYALESGFTPDFDTLGGQMAAVQRDMAQLPAEDRAAIAAYLKAVPARPDAHPPAAATQAPQ